MENIMEIIIKGEAKELAAFVLETQGQKGSEQGQPKTYYVGEHHSTARGDENYCVASDSTVTLGSHA